jgi:hypothetical protein
LAAGKSVLTEEGVAKSLTTNKLSHTFNLCEAWAPETSLRDKFLHNVAYWQWSVGELRSGAMWKYLKKKGLV